MSNLTAQEAATMTVELAVELAAKPIMQLDEQQVYIAKEFLADNWATLTEAQKEAHYTLDSHYDILIAE